VIEAMPEYIERLTDIARLNYVPTVNDILLSRVRTTGITEERFIIGDAAFVMFDVDGQRSEMKKWMHCFDGVNAVLFVAALSEFNQVLFEDEETNRMVCRNAH
jgi:hypothetical protein